MSIDSGGCGFLDTPGRHSTPQYTEQVDSCENGWSAGALSG